MDRHILLYHHPQSRSAGVRILLEELGADYAVETVSLKDGAQRRPEFLAINPMGKVPAIVHAGVLVTEQVAIYAYLADLYPEAGLAPPIGDPLRGPFLRWLAFYGSSFEPAIVDRALKREPAPRGMCPYGDYETMLGTLMGQLGAGDYLLGSRYSAADVLWATALRWMTGFGLLERTPVVGAYIDRVSAHAGFARAATADAALPAAG